MNGLTDARLLLITFSVRCRNKSDLEFSNGKLYGIINLEETNAFFCASDVCWENFGEISRHHHYCCSTCFTCSNVRGDCLCSTEVKEKTDLLYQSLKVHLISVIETIIELQYFLWKKWCKFRLYSSTDHSWMPLILPIDTIKSW